MTRKEFTDKWYTYGGSREVMESDLDEVLKEEAEKAYNEGRSDSLAVQDLKDNWKQLNK